MMKPVITPLVDLMAMKCKDSDGDGDGAAVVGVMML